MPTPSNISNGKTDDVNNEDVLDAKIHIGETIASSCLKTVFLISKFSMIASIIISHELKSVIVEAN